MSGIVEIIYDWKRKKLRAVAEAGGYVRFPNKLRIEGKRYYAEDLREGKAGSWIACGKIVEVPQGI